MKDMLPVLLNAALLGAALAMDAFSVSIANALREPDMKAARKTEIAGTYAFFQFLMPVAGWVCVRTILDLFTAFQKFIPWIALLLLAWIGGKMILEGIGKEKAAKAGKAEETAGTGKAGKAEETDGTGKGAVGKLTLGVLVMQGIATSIDALSTGFAFADYTVGKTLISAVIIAAETFLICLGGIRIGSRLGNPESGKASILGGVILILIGIEIFVRGVLGI